MSAVQAAQLTQALSDILTNTADIAQNEIDIAANTAQLADTPGVIGDPITGHLAEFDVDNNLIDSGASVTALLDRTNHTGTQTPATISPQGAGSGLDADLLDAQSGAFYRDVSNMNAGVLALARGGTAGNTRQTAQEGIGIFNGKVSAGGNISEGPGGWIASGPAANVYTVTHALGTTNYRVLLSAQTLDGNARIINLDTLNASSFTFLVFASGGGASTTNFISTFQLITD
jgi:hypothetical protein